MISIAMRKKDKTKRSIGFTLVELAIVIAVIAVLATIAFVGYKGVQEDARDTQRIADMTSIAKVLEVYLASNKSYPSPQGTNWEQSNVYSTNFLASLTTSGLTKDIPVDPVNDSRHHYRYYLYPSGAGCVPNKGPFYILQVVNLDKTSTNKPKNNPGFSCSGRNWTDEAWYTIGGYTRE